MTEPDLPAVGRALTDVARTQQQLDETVRLLSGRTQLLHDELLVYGAELRSADLSIDHELVRRLYWEAPSLPNKAVADAFGFRSPNDVPAIAGSREFDLPCIGCGTALHHVVRNRTHLGDLRRTNMCPRCADVAAERERRRRAEVDAEHRRYERERAAVLRQAMEAYVLAHPEMLDDSDDVGFYLDIPVPQWGVSTVSLADLNAVRRDLAARLTRS
jgi:hypothetical protein